MIESREQLIEEAKKQGTVEEKVRFVMDYFVKNVKYDYAYMFLSGFTRGSITNVYSNTPIPMSNLFAFEGAVENAMTYKHIGESEVLNDILKIRDENIGNYDTFIEELEVYVKNFLGERIENENVVDENTEAAIRKVDELMKKKVIFHFKNGTEIPFNWDISGVIMNCIMGGTKYFPTQFRKGILTNGVCDAYSEYLSQIFEELGVETHKIDGISVLKHSWLEVIDEEKNHKTVDLTRAVFIRDGYQGIPIEQRPEDWLYADTIDTFRMQPTRKIMQIDDKFLSVPITAENYDEKTLKKLLARGTRKHVDTDDFEM